MNPPEAIAFTCARGQRLQGLLHRAAESGPAAVVCHGMLSDKSSAKLAELAGRLVTRGVSALRFDFAGRGESEGTLETLTVSGEVEDLGAAVTWLRGQGYGPLGLAGSSLGGTVALLHAARDQEIRAVATINSPARLARLHEEIDREAWQRDGVLVLEQGRLGYGFYEDALTHDLEAAARAAGERLLVIQGAADAVVDPTDGSLLAQAALCDLLVLDGADHRLTDERHRERVLDTVTDFLAARLT